MMSKLLKSMSKFRASHNESFYMQAQLLQDRESITILDIGAYTGETVCKYVKTFSNAYVYAFEPFPDSFEKLVSTCKGMPVKTFNYAFSDNVEKIKLHVNADPSCNSIFPRVKDGKKYYSEKAENIGHIEVPSITIDHFCNEQKISYIDILKIDVEGAEIKVFSGGLEKFSSHAIGLIYAEVTFVPHYQGGCMFHELSVFLSKYDYTLLNFYNLKKSKSGQLRWGNAIFLSPQIRRKFERD